MAKPAEVPLRPFLQTAQIDLRGKRVLIVDDTETNQRVMTLQTQAWGMEALAIKSPQEAIEQLRAGKTFDIGLIDYQMPDMDGLTLAAEIRKVLGTRSFPLVLVSSIGRELIPSADIAAALIKPVRASQLYDVLIGLLAAKPEARPQAPILAPTEFDPQMANRLPLHILLAEDHAINQKLALLTLGRLGYRADVAANGLEVLAALDRQPYDVILMDMQMPEMDGLEATRRIRERQAGEAGPRIIAMTANVTKEDRQACLEAGMNDYLAKPIRVGELVTALSKVQPAPIKADTAVAAQPGKNQPAAEGVIDQAAINNLLSLVDGNRDDLKGLISSFINDTPKLLSDLHHALDTGDYELLRRAGHTLKSSCRDFGASRLAQLGKQLETLGKDKTIDGAAELLGEAEAEYGPVKIALEKIRAGE